VRKLVLVQFAELAPHSFAFLCAVFARFAVKERRETAKSAKRSQRAAKTSYTNTEAKRKAPGGIITPEALVRSSKTAN
jgi:hypothetical protein